ncbi:MAG: 50S ribosomal protein L6 [Rickettsiales bacterium]|jgi:large subunit ribosomal protein L6|nr:50S ribosomal protein L6 [Rickettsiales bacterium]
MSRAGKYPVVIPSGVTVSKNGDVIVVKGPKGTNEVSLAHKNADLVGIEIKDNQITVSPKDAEDKASRAMWGGMTRNIKIAVEGVSKGFKKEMGMKGVGFKASVKGKDLVLVAGYSHDVVLPIPAGLSVEIVAPTEFNIVGIDKQKVGQFADTVKKVRKPEPYKGKGIFYKNETIRRKEGKKK